ncbi:hypothetical protein I7I51_02568 [Histoplasma capsulatum]|uniref:Uncharacterized protein n=1 Tax=Ajellomyces capsulatus TaxID=5037 RepID=A0A8A1MAL1_AJECA|nr:hypothetical protein I7I51_02568 [Histoplasma capsulatum]
MRRKAISKKAKQNSNKADYSMMSYLILDIRDISSDTISALEDLLRSLAPHGIYLSQYIYIYIYIFPNKKFYQDIKTVSCRNRQHAGTAANDRNTFMHCETKDQGSNGKNSTPATMHDRFVYLS